MNKNYRSNFVKSFIERAVIKTMICILNNYRIPGCIDCRA